MIKVIGIAFLSILISSCGWQLKGNYIAVTKDMNINLLFDNLAPEVKRNFEYATRQHLRNMQDSSKSKIDIRIEDYEESKRVVSIGSDGRVSEYQINMSINYTIMSEKNNLMIDSNEIKVEGFYEFFPNDILASTEEEVQIKREMTEKLIMKLVFRLDSIMSKIN